MIAAFLTGISQFNVFSIRATGFQTREERFELNFMIRKTFLQMVKPGGKIILAAGQFVCCPAFNETPALSYVHVPEPNPV